MKTVAVIQARMGSTRLPGKVMMEVCGRTIIGHVILRVRACPQVDEVVVATTVKPTDDVIVTESEKHGAKCFRGSEHDVLERYYLAAKAYNAEIVVRVTSDCPLFDPYLLSRMLEYFSAERSRGRKIDYLSNSLRRTYPRGLDAEIFLFVALEHAYMESSRSYEREHVTPYIYQHPGLFTIRHFAGDSDCSFHRWTLDTEEDLKLIEEIYSSLDRNGNLFTTGEVLKLFEAKPNLIKINAQVRQKELGQ